MTKPSTRLLALLLALVLIGACSSTSSDDARADDDREETTDDGDQTDEDDGDDGAVLDYLVDSGFGEEGAECVIDSLEDQGIDVSSLDEDDLDAAAFGDLADAFGQAGADCVEEVAGDLGGLPDEAFDLSNPVAYDQFVKQFANGSGLSIEVSECVVDYLIDNDIDASTFLTEPDGDAIAAVQDAVESCQ